MKQAKKILEYLSKNKKNISPLLIVTHDHPDPDGLSSGYALKYLAYKKFGIRSKMVYSGLIGRAENKEMVQALKIPIEKLKKKDLITYNNFVLVDTQPSFQNNSFPPEKKSSMVIDQHPSPVKPNADLLIVDPSCGATCVILVEALKLAKLDIPVGLATSIAYGILSETLNLSRGATKRVVSAYKYIFPYCDLILLAQIQNPKRTKIYFQTVNRGLRNAQVNKYLISSHLGSIVDPDIVAEIADYLISYKGMKCAICTGRYDGTLRISLRCSNAKLAAGEILRQVVKDKTKAGGHGRVAGGMLTIGKNKNIAAWEKAEKEVVSNLKQCLKIEANGIKGSPFK